ncbi:MAG: hypothetical protein IGR92_03320 [Leptolyngbyaceae cyanobacterium T60_A2020_046]|nr:hypothetical protein [Leptolyngbyaceae cyanobacterium T60_A2020_046]
MQFKKGDRVEFTEKALELCDPAVSVDETRGTVLEIRPDGSLLVQFDDREPPSIYPARYFQRG